MFEQMRSDLAKRLGLLLDRFELISDRADEWGNKGYLAIRLGLGGSTAIFDAISQKARDQAGLCADSIHHLLIDRSLPVMFKKGVMKAESFAAQCESVLDQADREEAVGKAAFHDRLGMSQK